MANLTDQQSWQRLDAATHGALSTIHPQRGVDSVPVVFAIEAPDLFVPVDRIKAKSGRRLQRLANIDIDPRCVVLVQHWSEDWSELWWVRAHGLGVVVDHVPTDWHVRLAEKYPQYRDPGSLTGGIVIRVSALTGWAAD
jgi:PPOX class probable F420-dependent enzyme